MSLAWPISLVPEIAERRCVVVLGAGASAGSVSLDRMIRPPNWSKLLLDASRLVTDATLQTLVRSLVEKERFLDAAEIVLAKSNCADYADFIRQVFVDPRFQPSQIHEEVYKLDPKIVVTTNYDDIYEGYCRTGMGSQGYNVCRYYESHALNDVRSKMRIILKAHGCVSDPQKTILSRTQYHHARKDYPQFYNLLDSLFLTSTLLFIGCSLVDPDFQLLLENTNIKCPSAHPHYAIVERGQPAPLVTALRTVYNVESLEFPAGDYGKIVDGLRDLNDRVTEWRRTHP